jgi:hypothetical protein
MLSTAFPPRTSRWRFTVVPRFVPCNQAIHLPSRSIECITDLLAISCGAPERLLLPSRETDPRCVMSGVIL